ncbi:class 1b ribonucleoside-diphosphate reductase subunit beta [Corynebacterium sp. CCM 8835]|uniref:ribonucleoside-diphosphate reductase n=1 Tax=Corynebacterium antarcticum TaxID=2800405 RepID=A0ABS1FIF1_9CORY|nr:class 1b ribonucleoside-diphosphate reductase subunit beta [Corynebacterium antarcticum]MCK7642110.1 class 1b ribonucleoside-diphosphate reductase subunit beta [Corynebacterium antarcticum]MCK7661208.1 class 1b ribonucleoside-diphosphate reductase subunit beta [Corynebacterium antarcticum]MCL0245961.1 class 1b ribonucleoside-diphosphate reductase subunit beta [Corynebacterium antarcticum]MCX7491587.1 class 1b ribonucleoside-diphosphate reductase subunit beta [Corynebacterium antarcticum]
MTIADSLTPPQWRPGETRPLRPVNWNRLDDEKDLEIWQRLTANFWLPEKVPLSNDVAQWRNMDEDTRQLTVKVFTGLTLLDTVQATVGEISQIPDARTEHEQAVYANIAFMQAVHARSYSSVFSTLCSTVEIDTAYAWATDNPLLQQRATAVMEHYYGDDPLKRKVAATLLSSLLLYAGFYLPLRFSARGQMMNTADMIRLILRDKAVHGYYSGYKYQRGLDAHPERRAEMEDFTGNFVDELLRMELEYSSDLYQGFGLIEGVMAFVHYNADKALMNLGYPARFEEEASGVEPDVLAALAPESSETHDFFSGSGSSYVIGRAESTEESDWDF